MLMRFVNNHFKNYSVCYNIYFTKVGVCQGQLVAIIAFTIHCIFLSDFCKSHMECNHLITGRTNKYRAG